MPQFLVVVTAIGIARVHHLKLKEQLSKKYPDPPLTSELYTSLAELQHLQYFHMDSIMKLSSPSNLSSGIHGRGLRVFSTSYETLSLYE